MKTFFLLVVVLAGGCSVHAQVTFQWSRTPLSTLSSTVADGQGNLFFTASTSSNNASGKTFKAFKYDPAGNLLWEAQDSNHTNAVVHQADNAGAYYAGGNMRVNGGRQQAYVSKYAPDGTLLWKQLFNTANDSLSIVLALTVINDDVYICGRTVDSFAVTKVFTQKYNATGDLQWSHIDSLGNPDGDHVYKMVFDGTDLVLCGGTYTSTDQRLFLIKYGLAGNKVWEHVRSFGNSNVFINELVTDGNKDIYVLMNSIGNGRILFKHDSNGHPVWDYTALYNSGPAPSTSYSGMKVDAANNIYLAGDVSSATVFGDYYFSLVKIRPNGSTAFRYQSTTTSSRAAAVEVLTPDNILVAGKDNGVYRLFNFDSTGTVKWAYNFQNDVPNATPVTMMLDRQKNIILKLSTNSFHFAKYTQSIAVPPVLSVSSIPIRCVTPGSATAIASSGIMPYTYHWSGGQTTNTISAATPGNYSVTVTDANGSTATQSTNVVRIRNGCAISTFPVITFPPIVWPN